MLEVGQQVGNYRVLRLIGEGGMGLVYQAQHQYIGRQAAIKILRPELKGDGESITRFLNEARAVTLIKHPGLLEIFEYGLLPDGSPHIIMELLSGETLAARIRKAKGRCTQAPLLGRGIALALSAAHKVGVVHRDLKPHNVFLIADPEQVGAERVKVIDFGIAKLDMAALPPEQVELGAPVPRTRSGAVLGTPEYMAPEQCLGAAQADAKTDVYALGVILYEMLAGRRPFVSELPSEVMTLQVRSAPPPLRTLVPTLPEELVALVHRMLSKRPADRPTMSQVAERLLPWVDTPLALSPAVSSQTPPDASRTQSSLHAELGVKPPVSLGLGLGPDIPGRSVGWRAALAPASRARAAAVLLMLLLTVAILIVSARALRPRKSVTSAAPPPRATAATVAPSAMSLTAAAAEFPAKVQPQPTVPELKAPPAPPPMGALKAAAKPKAPAAGGIRRSNDLVVPLFKAKRPGNPGQSVQ